MRRVDIATNAEEMQKAAEAASLRAQGLTYRQIAERVGCSPYTAAERVKRAVNAVPVEAVTVLREIQLDSLALQKRQMLRVLLTPHPKVDHGKLIFNPERPDEPLQDHDITIRASAELRKIEDSISRLTGTRAPVVHEVHEISEDALDAELRRLSTLIGDRSKRIAQGPTERLPDWDDAIPATAYPTGTAALPPGEADPAAATAEAGG